MIKKWITAGLLFCLFSGIPILQASVAQDEDFGLWSQNDIEAKINDRWKARAGEEVRFREHAGISYYDTHIGTAFQVWKSVLLGADYFQVRQTRTLGKKSLWYWESRPRIYVTLQCKYKGFSFDNRNLLEFRFKQNTEDTTRYRNMVTVTAPWKWTRFEFQPYIANEVFFETNRNGLVEDRLYNGVKYHLWRNLYGSCFYLRQYSKNSLAKWKEFNVLGIGFKVSL